MLACMMYIGIIPMYIVYIGCFRFVSKNIENDLMSVSGIENLFYDLRILSEKRT